MVPGMHMCVHICPAQAGAWLRGTHLSAWQQTAGTQSPSFAHAGAGAAGADDAIGAPPDVSADGLAHPNTAISATHGPLRMRRTVPETTGARSKNATGRREDTKASLDF